MDEEFDKRCTIECNEELGRYVKAKDIIKAGETILCEKPVLILSHVGDKRCCNCFKYAENYCRKCFISPLCSGCPSHHAYDCDKLSAMSNVKFEDLKHYPDCYGLLKLLLLNENSDTVSYFEQILKLESHRDKKQGTAIWKDHNKKIIQPISKAGVKEYLKSVCDFNEDFLQHLCGIIDVNCYEIRAPDAGAMRALYLNTSLLAHDCTANCNVAIDQEYRMKIYTNRCIEPNQLLTNCYTNVLLGTHERRHILLEGKYFGCHCLRCEDPTELGSHISSLICSHCSAKQQESYLVRNQSKNNDWCCQNCPHSLRAEKVFNLLEKIREETYHASDDLKRYEILLAKLSTILHKNHYLMVDIKQNIANILRSFITSSFQRPGRRLYERKVRLCQDLVLVLNIIQPGINRLKALALYELSNASAELYRLRFGEKEITADELSHLLKQCEAMLREAIRMLLYEPPETPEGQLMRSAMAELKDLQNDLKLLVNDHVEQ